jgi:hypothetical protein
MHPVNPELVGEYDGRGFPYATVHYDCRIFRWNCGEPVSGSGAMGRFAFLVNWKSRLKYRQKP